MSMSRKTTRLWEASGDDKKQPAELSTGLFLSTWQRLAMGIY